MKTIRWGIIGCGDVTEVKSGPGFQKARNSELVAVMRRNGALAGDYARRHNVPKWYDDAGSLIHDSEVDAVYVATPPSSHKEYTIAAVTAGKPVFVEKPMAVNHAECQDMVTACKEAGVPLFVAYYRRAQDKFRAIKSLLDDGVVGDVRCVNIRFYQPPSEDDFKKEKPWRVDPAIAGAGYFYDLGSHMVDILDFFLGPVSSVSGYSSNQNGLYPAEDIVSTAFMFESGVHGTGTWCFSAAEHLDYTEIIGSKGKLTYATFSQEPVRLYRDGKTETFEIAPPEHVHQPLIQTVVDELTGTGICPSTGISGARASRVLEKMLGDK